ncbi:hypothetical protein JAAARDRAFT_712510 [Jaapia argillacea MUCL 33604]|uniref:Ubiquitin-like protease family profile domain-containing protein n=1 Tax=Jaapia argillacea MUCL 33604 TaxID=933084 RepID=A0A067Q2W6_9AGAM|nr:hypothetical protein JAAARDRAFT_712510 [Jaapia argillacea MUCL 33604]
MGDIRADDEQGFRKAEDLTLTLRDVPPITEDFFLEALAIPVLLLPTLLPKQDISVVDFVNRKLPPFTPEELINSPKALDLSFSSGDAPDPDPTPEKLLQVTVPPLDDIHRLLASHSQAWLNGQFDFSHRALHGARGASRLGAHVLGAPPLLARHALRMAACLDMVQENEDQGRNVSLAHYFSQDWFNDIHVNELISVLDHEISDSSPYLPQNHLLLTTYTTKRLRDTYRRLEETPYSVENYLWKIGTSLSIGGLEVIAGVFLVGGNHWVAVVVEVTKRNVLYGDSFGAPPDSTIVAALMWWLAQHVSGEFSLSELGVAKQRDSFSCGLLAFNALAVYFLPSQYSLLDSTETSCDFGRMAMFRRVLRCIQTKQFYERMALLSSTKSPDDTQLAFPPSTTDLPILLADLTLTTKQPSAPKRPHEDVASPTTERTPAMEPDTPASPSIPRSPKKKKVKTLGPLKPSKAKTLTSKGRKSKPQSSMKQPSLHASFSGLTTKNQTLASISASDEDNDSESSGDNTSNRPHTKSIGRPRITLLDDITVTVPTNDPAKFTYRCVGMKCTKTWSNRNSARIFAHATLCCGLKSAVRKVISVRSAGQSLGARMARTDSTVAIAPPPDPSTAVEELDTTPTSHAFDTFKTQGHIDLQTKLDFAIMKFVCVCGIPPHVVDLEEFKNILAVANSNYNPVSRTTLVDVHITREREHIHAKQIKILSTERNLTLGFDGGSTMGKYAFYTVSVNTTDRRKFFLEGEDCMGVVHSRVWIKDLLLDVMQRVGTARFASVSSDNTGNTQVARRELCLAVKTLINVPDPIHLINNAIQDIVKTKLRGVIKFFNKSTAATTVLRTERRSVIGWWEVIQNVPEASLLANLAIKLYSIVPHSMDDERIQSVFHWMNSAHRSRQKVDTIVAMAQVRQCTLMEESSDAEESDADSDDDDDDENSWLEGAAPNVELSEKFDLESGDEGEALALDADELLGVLAEKPVALKTVVSHSKVEDVGDGEEDEDGDFSAWLS